MSPRYQIATNRCSEDAAGRAATPVITCQRPHHRTDRTRHQHQDRPEFLPARLLSPQAKVVLRPVHRMGQVKSGGALAVQAQVIDPLGAVRVGAAEGRLERHPLRAERVQALVVSLVQHLHSPLRFGLRAGQQPRSAELQPHPGRNGRWHLESDGGGGAAVSSFARDFLMVGRPGWRGSHCSEHPGRHSLATVGVVWDSGRHAGAGRHPKGH